MCVATHSNICNDSLLLSANTPFWPLAGGGVKKFARFFFLIFFEVDKKIIRVLAQPCECLHIFWRLNGIDIIKGDIHLRLLNTFGLH